MQKIATVSDLALSRLVLLMDGDAKRGLMFGASVAVLFLWGP